MTIIIMRYLAFMTVILITVQARPDGSNLTLSKGSHHLFKLDKNEDNSGGGKRNSRCTPCRIEPGERREITNYLDPEYRGNGADNLGYDWSPRAWGGPAFSNRMKNQGRTVAKEGWDRSRGGRQMPGNWGMQTSPRFTCDSCRMIWEQERNSGTNRFGNFNNRMGRWQGDRSYQGNYQGEFVTVTSPPIALRPEGRIAYVPSPGGEMYWDGISGGGTRWDGFSNGISWLGNPYDPRGYDQGQRRPDHYKPNYFGRPWINEPNQPPPSWFEQGKNYQPPTMDHDTRYNGYASKWHYGTTNQNGWNGNNMKWSYGSKNWDYRGGSGYYGNGSPGGKFEEDGNPLPHGEGSSTYPHGTGDPRGGSNHGQRSSLNPYGQGGRVQYGQGGSIYFDQGNYIFHYGRVGSSKFESSRYPPDGKFPPYSGAKPDYGSQPLRPQRPWDHGINDRYDNREPAHSNNNWIRPAPADPGYSKLPSPGKYPSSEFNKNKKPWQRPGPGPGRPDPSSGYPQGDTGYITGSILYEGHRYPNAQGEPGYQGGSGGPGYLGQSGSSGYLEGSGGSRYPGQSVGPGYPGGGGNSGYPGGSGGGGGGGNSGYPGGIGGSRYPGQSVGPGYPGGGGNSGYPGGSGGSRYSGQGGSSNYPGDSGGSGYHGQNGGSGYPGGFGGSGYHEQSGGSGYPVGSGSSGYLGGRGGPAYIGGSGSSSYPAGIGSQGNTGLDLIHGYSTSHGSIGGYNRPVNQNHELGPGGNGNHLGLYSNRIPPKGYYTGFITELHPNKYPSNVQIGQGNLYHPQDSYPGYDGQWGENRYPGGEKYPLGIRGEDYPGNSDHPDKYPEASNGGHRYRPGSQNGDNNAGGDSGAWNYGQESHKDGIYRRTGGSYPPYRGGPYYTSSYLASASTPAGASQSPSEGKTNNVPKTEDVTKATSESA